MTATAYIVLFRMDRADKQQALEAHLSSPVYDENWKFSDGVMVVQSHLPLATIMENVREAVSDTGAVLGDHDLFFAGPLTRPYVANMPPAAIQWLEDTLPHTRGAAERY
jgi:hypothetical protein